MLITYLLLYFSTLTVVMKVTGNLLKTLKVTMLSPEVDLAEQSCLYLQYMLKDDADQLKIYQRYGDAPSARVELFSDSQSAFVFFLGTSYILTFRHAQMRL